MTRNQCKVQCIALGVWVFFSFFCLLLEALQIEFYISLNSINEITIIEAASIKCYLIDSVNSQKKTVVSLPFIISLKYSEFVPHINKETIQISFFLLSAVS